jgi:hypothetical protein
MEKLRFMKKLLYVGVLALIMAGCYPKGPVYVTDTDMVLTTYSDTFDFGAAQTYFLFDTIISIEGADPVSEQYSNAIISEIEANMTNLGYTRNIDKPQEPDIFITTTAWTQTSTDFYYSGYDYWGYGYPGYGVGYGWGYPYYGWATAYSYSSGTILIEMSDGKNIDTENQIIPVVWMAVINGLVQNNNASDVQSRIQTTIDQAFEQSPYILSNPE